MSGAGTRVTAAIGSVAFLLTVPVASAITPPDIGPDVAPPMGDAGPRVAMAQRTECAESGIVPDSAPVSPEPNQQMLNLAQAWRFSRGEGQKVAVIDTGVAPGPRLPNLDPGGDYVAETRGLSDCDGHGTLVAGIIAGQPGDDSFSGVAPAARVLSIRQASAAYSPREPGSDPANTRAAVDLASLASAVVRAVDLGARVINISVSTCLPPDHIGDQQVLGAALRYAALDKDAVIVAAGGDVGFAGLSAGFECQPNPITTSPDPGDTRNWAGVASVSAPSWWQPYVLSVGSVTASGRPSNFTMPGPWLGIAAPGENVVSLSNSREGGLANGFAGPRGRWTTLNGTGYAAAYVAGVAALVRSRFPDLTAAQVIARLTLTAHNGARNPSNLVGAGIVDPLAALTWQLPAGASDQASASLDRIAPPVAAPSQNHAPRIFAFAGTATLALAVSAIAFVASRRNGDKQ